MSEVEMREQRVDPVVVLSPDLNLEGRPIDFTLSSEDAAAVGVPLPADGLTVMFGKMGAVPDSHDEANTTNTTTLVRKRADRQALRKLELRCNAELQAVLTLEANARAARAAYEAKWTPARARLAAVPEHCRTLDFQFIPTDAELGKVVRTKSFNLYRQYGSDTHPEYHARIVPINVAKTELKKFIVDLRQAA